MTDLRASQDTAEAWVMGDPDLIASQALAEAWVRNTPITFLVGSQVLAEVWGIFSDPVPVIPVRRHMLSSQVV